MIKVSIFQFLNLLCSSIHHNQRSFNYPYSKDVFDLLHILLKHKIISSFSLSNKKFTIVPNPLFKGRISFFSKTSRWISISKNDLKNLMIIKTSRGLIDNYDALRWSVSGMLVCQIVF